MPLDTTLSAIMREYPDIETGTLLEIADLLDPLPQWVLDLPDDETLKLLLEPDPDA